MARNEPKKALAEVERIDKSASRLLYLYEKGLTLHSLDEYAKSNGAFAEAELLLEDLYTKSVTREATALLVTDAVRQYRGDDFETVFVNYYKLFNYIYLGDMQGALVECRRLNEKLQRIGDSTGQPAVHPFLHYVTGLVYALGGDFSDADVSYRVALDGYAHLDRTAHIGAPSYLYCDLAANSRLLGDLDMSRTYEEHCSETRSPGSGNDKGNGNGSVTLFLECGWIAHKTELDIVVPIFKGELDDERFDSIAYSRTLADRHGAHRFSERKLEYLLKVAIPQLSVPPNPRRYARIRVRGSSGDGPAQTALVENLDSFAVRAYEDEQGKILLRTLFRGLTKYLAKRKASDKDVVLGWLVNAANFATEVADTRSWSTLPGRILMGRIELPPGTYDLEVSVYDGAGLTDEFTLHGIEFVSGRRSLLNYRVY